MLFKRHPKIPRKTRYTLSFSKERTIPAQVVSVWKDRLRSYPSVTPIVDAISGDGVGIQYSGLSIEVEAQLCKMMADLLETSIAVAFNDEIVINLESYGLHVATNTERAITALGSLGIIANISDENGNGPIRAISIQKKDATMLEAIFRMIEIEASCIDPKGKKKTALRKLHDDLFGNEEAVAS